MYSYGKEDGANAEWQNDAKRRAKSDKATDEEEIKTHNKKYHLGNPKTKLFIVYTCQVSPIKMAPSLYHILVNSLP